jgi:hypothetical protein
MHDPGRLERTSFRAHPLGKTSAQGNQSTPLNPTTPCAGGGGELNVEQSLEVNGALAARAIDNGTTGATSRAILCFVSANNYLYPTTAPTWGPLTGAIWKD